MTSLTCIVTASENSSTNLIVVDHNFIVVVECADALALVENVESNFQQFNRT